MPLIRLRLEYDLANQDGPGRVVADLRDMRAWEKANNGQPFAVDTPDLGRLSYLAWHAARRTGQYAGSFMEWDAICTSVSDLGEEEVNPTQPGPGDS
jgi:hypothetical protein